MHISEGILSGPVLLAGGGLAAVGVAIGLRRLRDEQIPAAAVLASAFFIASFIHVNVGPASVHLVLNGLAGLLLGWAAFPALLVGLLLQAVLFGYGGITVLGVNTVIMAAPAVACHYAFGRAVRRPGRTTVLAAGALAGATAVAGGVLLLAASMLVADRSFAAVARLAMISHLPILPVEAFVTASAVAFIAKVRPELLHNSTVAHQQESPPHA